MKFYLIFFVLLIFSSCTSNDFRMMEPSGNNPGITLELKQSRGLFGQSGEFELKLTNNSSIPLNNCRLEFNNKFSHNINGLHIREKGLFKSDVFQKDDTLIIPFTENVENMLFFNVPEEGFKKENVKLICDECNVSWAIE